MTELAQKVLGRLKYRLTAWYGNEVSCYAGDLVATLFKEEKKNGSFGDGEVIAAIWIRLHFDDLDEVFDEIQERGIRVNPFREPERFQVLAYLIMGDYLATECSKTLAKLSSIDVPFTFTDDLIDKIISEWDEAEEEE
jgi:ACT domain-containing protein